MKEMIKSAFRKRIYFNEKKKEKERMILIQKELKKKFGKEEEKRKTISKKTKTISKKIKINNKPKPKKIKIDTPNTSELQLLLEKNTNKYDTGIKKSRKLHSDLVFLGLTDSGLKEHPGESMKQRKKRIKKINKIHSELIKVLEENKHLEKRIEIIHKKLNKKLEILRK